PVFTLGFVTKSLGDIRGTNTQNTEDEDIRDDVNGLSLSWGLGGGIEYEFATSATLVAGIAYQQLFTDVTSDHGSVIKNNIYEKEDSKGTLGMVSVRIGIFF
ncbi:MAG: PorT family protein, partial [Saprospiraceae bacterium]|nr:PorT family protein [Saprospiraceae bacterium]